ncbi:FAD-binding protein [Actinomadura sp. WMMB 499]|uniref:FAD-binding protein n=1 Tax=Actinomadura sp. WMMB 499 TaxID=1219491 RepID=UPI0012484DAD|nr:FAD-binding protein [Actinomadura sp. WMMB 499]QFG26050.1 FAD-binding protein [Actinomadura sp. WMMB 499]
MRDFGGIVERAPARVVRPGSAAEVAGALREAAADGLDAVPRGRGHSTFGQSLTEGVSLDMRGLAGVHAVRTGDDGTVHAVVGAGTTWREVLDATLPYGLAPPVLTDHLDVTVGGTLSAGGVGGTSHRHGPAAANVTSLEVVRPGLGTVECSPGVRPELFDAVRAGLGRHGVITRAALRLVPVPDRVLCCTIPCRDAADLLRVQRTARAEHVSGQAKPADGGGWRYEAKAVLHDGAPPPGTTETEELSYLDFADRLRPDVAELVALGEWARPHPWGMVFLPGDRAAALIEDELRATGPGDVGLSGVVLIKALRAGGLPALAVPADPVLLGMLRTASPGCATVPAMLAANRALLHRARAAGGARYPVDAVDGEASGYA